MNNNQRFDDNIKEQFEDYTPLVQPHIWDNIVAERKKRKPVGFWFTFFNGRNILGLSLLLLAAGGGAFILFNKQASTKQNQPVAASAAQNITTPASNATVVTASEKNITNNNPVTTNNAANEQASIGINKPAVANDNAGADNSTTGYTTFNKAGGFKTKIYSPFAQDGDENTKTGKSKKHNATKCAMDMNFGCRFVERKHYCRK
ncbi:MAG: hypothetical protein WDM90_05885 [Ferruginibacter sp.]